MKHINKNLEHLELHAIMSMPAGRSVMTRILEELGLWTSTYNSDPVKLAYNAALQSKAVEIADRIRTELPGSWMQLLTERMERLNPGTTDKGEDNAGTDDYDN